MSDEMPGGPIARRDELLELLYWLEGEGFGGASNIDAIVRFLAHPEPAVRQSLDDLVRRGDILLDQSSGEYRLTDTGRGEAARRFAEEFASLLSQGHGECNDPDCDCHTNPAGAAECHAARGHKH
ncbi:MAG: hypothetical protein ABI037_09460 [Gemmatimonadales bacterium]